MSQKEEYKDYSITTREQLRESIEELCQEIVSLFKVKNTSYGDTNDAFYNFRETARRITGSTDVDAMLQQLIVYVDKHWVAITKNGAKTPEVRERFMDIIVYSLIAITMLDREGGR